MRSFPEPWSVVETTGQISIKDASGRSLAYFYWWGNDTTSLLTRDEAKFLAEAFVRMPKSMPRPVIVEDDSTE
jgi:hypothetical protein